MYWIEVRLLQRNACAARSSTCIAGEHGRIWMTVHRYVQLWRDLHLQEHDNLALKQDAVNVGIGNVQRHTTQDSDSHPTVYGGYSELDWPRRSVHQQRRAQCERAFRLFSFALPAALLGE